MWARAPAWIRRGSFLLKQWRHNPGLSLGLNSSSLARTPPLPSPAAADASTACAKGRHHGGKLLVINRLRSRWFHASPHCTTMAPISGTGGNVTHTCDARVTVSRAEKFNCEQRTPLFSISNILNATFSCLGGIVKSVVRSKNSGHDTKPSPSTSTSLTNSAAGPVSCSVSCARES